MSTVQIHSLPPGNMASRTLDSPSKKLWFAAIKPPMYSVAVMPIWVGTAVAYAETGRVNLGTFLTFLLSAILILAWENLANDVFDSETGVDVNKAESLVNLTRNKALIFWIGNGCLGLGLVGIGAIALGQKDFTVLGLIGLCCALGYVYQGPPFRLGYRGLGEFLCFFAFGPVGCAAVYYSQTQAWSGKALAISTIVGMATSIILFCSHFHQGQDDRRVGKRSPIVRLGTARAARLLPWLCGSLYAVALVGVAVGAFPWTTLLMGFSAPVALRLCRHVLAHHNQPEAVRHCKYAAVVLHFWSGLLLGLGLGIERSLDVII
jgi:2-carboxy-1,4-naphthoquinone phytyltransferase